MSSRQTWTGQADRWTDRQSDSNNAPCIYTGDGYKKWRSNLYNISKKGLPCYRLSINPASFKTDKAMVNTVQSIPSIQLYAKPKEWLYKIIIKIFFTRIFFYQQLYFWGVNMIILCTLLPVSARIISNSVWQNLHRSANLWIQESCCQQTCSIIL